MSLERELEDIWESAPGDCLLWSRVAATMDFPRRKESWNMKLKEVSKLIEDNLPLALTSPSEYVRYFAELLDKETKMNIDKILKESIEYKKAHHNIDWHWTAEEVEYLYSNTLEAKISLNWVFDVQANIDLEAWEARAAQEDFCRKIHSTSLDRERYFKAVDATINIISENIEVALVSPSDYVREMAKLILNKKTEELTSTI